MWAEDYQKLKLFEKHTSPILISTKLVSVDRRTLFLTYDATITNQY